MTRAAEREGQIGSNDWYPGKPLTEVEQLRAEIERLRARVAYLEKLNSDASWKLNPDRSGGYTPPEEIERLRNGGW